MIKQLYCAVVVLAISCSQQAMISEPDLQKVKTIKKEYSALQPCARYRREDLVRYQSILQGLIKKYYLSGSIAKLVTLRQALEKSMEFLALRHQYKEYLSFIYSYGQLCLKDPKTSEKYMHQLALEKKESELKDARDGLLGKINSFLRTARDTHSSEVMLSESMKAHVETHQKLLVSYKSLCQGTSALFSKRVVAPATLEPYNLFQRVNGNTVFTHLVASGLEEEVASIIVGAGSLRKESLAEAGKRVLRKFFKDKGIKSKRQQLKLRDKVDNVSLLQKNPELPFDFINDRNADGSTALHKACSLSRTALAHMLIEAGADLMVYDQAGYLPFHRAVMAGNTELIAFFINHPLFDISTPTRDGKSPLALAVTAGHDEVANKLLTAHPFSISTPDEQGFTLLDCAIRAKLKKLTQLLIMKGSGISRAYAPADATFLLKLKEELLAQKISPNDALFIKSAFSRVIAEIEARRPAPKAVKQKVMKDTALVAQKAAEREERKKEEERQQREQKQRKEFVRLVKKCDIKNLTKLLQAGISFEMINDEFEELDGVTPLEYAVFTLSDARLVSLLGKGGAHPEALSRMSCKKNIYLEPTYGDREKVLAALLDIWCPEKQQLFEEFLVLHSASLQGSERCTKLLLARYGNEYINSPDKYNWRPLEVTKNKEIKALLLAHGAQDRIKDEPTVPQSEQEVQHYFDCCERGDLEGLQQLFKDGRADVCWESEQGYAGLHVATAHLRPEIINCLIDQGANRLKTTLEKSLKFGYKPFDIALKAAPRDLIRHTTVEEQKIDNFLKTLRYLAVAGHRIVESLKDKVRCLQAIVEGDVKRIHDMFHQDRLDIQWENGTPEGAHESLLHVAVRYGQKDIIKFFLNHKFEVDTLDSDGQTALRNIKCHPEDQELCKMLLEAGIPVAQVAINERSIFYDLVNVGELAPETLDIFLGSLERIMQKRVSLDLKDTFGDTILHYMVKQGIDQPAFFKLFMLYGAPITARDAQGKTAKALVSASTLPKLRAFFQVT